MCFEKIAVEIRAVLMSDAVSISAVVAVHVLLLCVMQSCL